MFIYKDACICQSNLSCRQQTIDLTGWCLSSPNPMFVWPQIWTGDGDDSPQPNKIRTSGRLRMEVWLWCGQPTGTRNMLVMKKPGQKSPHLNSLWWWWRRKKRPWHSTFMFRNCDYGSDGHLWLLITVDLLIYHIWLFSRFASNHFSVVFCLEKLTLRVCYVQGQSISYSSKCFCSFL